jgi:monoamine oxidase
MMADGYQTLPKTLATEFERECGEVYLNHRLKTFDRTSEGLIKLNFVDRAGHSLPPVFAKHLILAMPKRSLELLAEENQQNFLFSNSTFQENIQTVSGGPAYKLFLGYHHPWWHLLDIHGGTSATDWPMQGANLYVCGEAYSNMQGWVQGALNSAELMLEENFNLSRPAWLPPSYDLGS